MNDSLKNLLETLLISRILPFLHLHWLDYYFYHDRDGLFFLRDQLVGLDRPCIFVPVGVHHPRVLEHHFRARNKLEKGGSLLAYLLSPLSIVSIGRFRLVIAYFLFDFDRYPSRFFFSVFCRLFSLFRRFLLNICMIVWSKKRIFTAVFDSWCICRLD